MTKDISLKFGCLPIAYIFIVAGPHLMVRDLRSKASLTNQGCHKNHSKWCTLTSHDFASFCDPPWGGA